MTFRLSTLLLALASLFANNSYAQNLWIHRTIDLGQNHRIQVEFQDSTGTTRQQFQNYQVNYWPTRSEWIRAENYRKLGIFKEILDDFYRYTPRKQGMSDSDRDLRNQLAEERHKTETARVKKDSSDKLDELLRPLEEKMPKFEEILKKRVEQAKLKIEQRRIRNDIAQTLELLRTNSGNIDVEEKSLCALETLHDANRFSYQPETKHLSERLTRRAENIYADLNPESGKSNQAETISAAADKAFSLGEVDTKTFAGREIIFAANEASLSPGVIESDVLRFHVSTALQQAQMDSARGDWKGALNQVDRAWNAVDYSRGLVKGLYEFGADTVNGMTHLVAHPIDSAEALYNAVVNCDRTYELIRSSVAQIIDEYDTYSAEEKGKLHAKTVAEIISTVFGVGTLKQAGNVGKFAKAVEKVAEESVKASKMAARNTGGGDVELGKG